MEGKTYTVEVTDNNLNVNESVSIYRSSEHTSSSKIGSGSTSRMALLPITGEGSVLALHVKEGDEVKRGDLLLELCGGGLPAYTAVSNEITAPEDGVITAINAASGMAVQTDQALATYCPADSLQVALNVNEADLSLLKVGDVVTLGFLDGTGHGTLQGMVASISSQSHATSGDAEYKAYIDFTPDDATAWA